MVGQTTFSRVAGDRGTDSSESQRTGEAGAVNFLTQVGRVGVGIEWVMSGMENT